MLGPDMQHAITHIHSTPYKLVLEFAGAGSLALWLLHSVPGSSRTLLEATDRYASASLSDLLGWRPETFVSVETAMAMAQQAYERAVYLDDAQPRSSLLLGVACTATIATNYIKHGEHRCIVAVQNTEGITTYDLRMKKGHRDRMGEEMLVSHLLLRAIISACGHSMATPLDLAAGEGLHEHHMAFTDPISCLLTQQVDTVLVYPDGCHVADEPISGAILPGAFNPLHEGHLRLAQAASDTLGMPVTFELSILNADKGKLSAASIEERVQQFRSHHPLVLSRAPLFRDKASLFPGCVFVIGYDTARRLVSPSYYGEKADMYAALEAIRTAGCRFLVAGRFDEGTFHILSDISLPPAYNDLFLELPEEQFRVDLSSSTIRESLENMV